ncbi:hypothetical protein H4Q26_007567 [Puccinia striiformis f. sp. tritici PST-130]|nr:hypothetical protein H4Q26_007567 [Puccinia striiformis f. sp. tritici PST-130]
MEEAKKNKKIRVRSKRGWAEHELKNLEKAKQFIAHAADNRADLIIFPEYFMTGLIDNDLHLADKEFKWIKEFQNLAIRYKIDILPGTIVEQEEEEGKLFNSCAGRKENGFLGRSTVNLPLKGNLLGFIEPDEQIQIIDIDLSVLQDVREVYKIRHEFDSKSFA